MVTNTFFREKREEERVSAHVNYSAGLEIKKMKFELVSLKPFSILSFS